MVHTKGHTTTSYTKKRKKRGIKEQGKLDIVLRSNPVFICLNHYHYHNQYPAVYIVLGFGSLHTLLDPGRASHPLTLLCVQTVEVFPLTGLEKDCV